MVDKTLLHVPLLSNHHGILATQVLNPSYSRSGCCGVRSRACEGRARSFLIFGSTLLAALLASPPASATTPGYDDAALLSHEEAEPFVQTPNGMFPASCVNNVPPKSKIDANLQIVHEGTVVGKIMPCVWPTTVDSHGRLTALPRSALGPTGSAPDAGPLGWAATEDLEWPDGCTDWQQNCGPFVGIFGVVYVPPVPQTWQSIYTDDQGFYIWNGIEDTANGLQQPLLEYDGTTQTWNMVAYVIAQLYPQTGADFTILSSPVGPVNPGDPLSMYIQPNAKVDNGLTEYLQVTYDQYTQLDNYQIYTPTRLFVHALMAVLEFSWPTYPQGDNAMTLCQQLPSSDYLWYTATRVWAPTQTCPSGQLPPCPDS